MDKLQTLQLLHRLMTRPDPDIPVLRDAFDLCRSLDDHQSTPRIRSLLSPLIHSPQTAAAAVQLYNDTLIYDAPVSFDCFMLALERNRPPKEQFWLPRRRKLMHICRALQDMEDGMLDELFLSQPPRTGKTTLMLMFFLWVMGRDSERSNLYCSYTDSVVNVLYNGLLEVRNDPVTYAYADLFPESTVASTNAKDLLINFDRKKRYASFTGRSLYGTLNGACDCNGYLVADDLVSGDEEARSKDRLRNVWTKVDNNMLPRAKESAKILWIGTRWSLIDPQGVRTDLLQNEPQYAGRRWRSLNTSALDEADESNFEYSYGVGFSTDFYHQRRASFERNNDMASWLAQYQGVPIEREGAVFEPDGLRYFNGVLPEGQPDRVFMTVDPSWGGGDFTAGPVCVQYGDDLYVVDLIYDNSEKNITQPKIVNLIEKYGVAALKVEGTKMTASYGEAIDKTLRDKGIRINVQINTSHFTGTGKQQRIFDKAPDIRERMVFLSEGHRSKEYSLAMQNLFSFTINARGRNIHDDFPDACAMTVDFAFFGGPYKAEVFNKPW